MDQTMCVVFLGIVSSLVATFIFLTLSWLVRDNLIPWYLDKTYRGVRLDGLWTAATINGEAVVQNQMSMQIAQKSNLLSGVYFHASTDHTEYYTVKGVIQDGIVTLTWHPQSKKTVDAGAAVFRTYSSQSALRMTGTIVLYSGGTGAVDSVPIEFSQVTT